MGRKHFLTPLVPGIDLLVVIARQQRRQRWGRRPVDAHERSPPAVWMTPHPVSALISSSIQIQARSQSVGVESGASSDRGARSVDKQKAEQQECPSSVKRPKPLGDEFEVTLPPSMCASNPTPVHAYYCQYVPAIGVFSRSLYILFRLCKGTHPCTLSYFQVILLFL